MPAPISLSTLLLSALLAFEFAAAQPLPDLSPVPPRPQASRLKPGWQQGPFMEIFVRAYQDSDGDGIGDLRGLTQRLDYLQELGVRGIWLMPIMPSADHDHGYASTDYRAIEPQYGSMADFDEFLRQAHRRGIGVIIDYVINHSAAAHPLFQAAAADKQSPWRDWYVWADPAPTGWDIWGKNPWYPSAQGESYFATFGPHMPDFNMRNPAVVAYHRSSMRFWLNKGLDGFRLDAVPHLVENSAQDWNDQPESRRLTRAFQRLIKAYPRRTVVCEATASPIAYAAPEVCGSAFAFGLQYEVVKAARGDAKAIQAVADYFKTAPASMATMLANHDIFAGQRVWDQLQDTGEQATARYKLAAATYLLQPGIPYLYYGEEIGMAGVTGLDGDEPLRAPMSWVPDGEPGGFSSSATPFRPLAPNRATHNVQSQRQDPESLLNFYKALLKLRSQHPALQSGRYEQAVAEGQVLRFVRHLGKDRLLVAINYGESSAKLAQAQGLLPLFPQTAATSTTLAPLSVSVFRLKPAKKP